jgi:hypothetical protein
VDITDLLALPILSVRQPWASYLTGGLKSIELRTWSTDYRGWLWIHAAKQLDLDAMEIYDLQPSHFPTGGLVGIADLAACKPIESPTQWAALRNEHRSPGTFARGIIGWRFRDAVALREKIDSRGELRLFSLDMPTRARVAKLLEESPVHGEFVETVADLRAPVSSRAR